MATPKKPIRSPGHSWGGRSTADMYLSTRRPNLEGDHTASAQEVRRTLERIGAERRRANSQLGGSRDGSQVSVEPQTPAHRIAFDQTFDAFNIPAEPGAYALLTGPGTPVAIGASHNLRSAIRSVYLAWDNTIREVTGCNAAWWKVSTGDPTRDALKLLKQVNPPYIIEAEEDGAH